MVYMVYLVYLVYLIYLVYMAYLVISVYLVVSSHTTLIQGGKGLCTVIRWSSAVSHREEGAATSSSSQPASWCPCPLRRRRREPSFGGQ